MAPPAGQRRWLGLAARPVTAVDAVDTHGRQRAAVARRTRVMKSERDLRGHEHGTGLPGGDGPAEVEGVELEVLPGLPGPPLAARRAGQGEGEGLTVAARPVSDDVGDEA